MTMIALPTTAQSYTETLSTAFKITKLTYWKTFIFFILLLLMSFGFEMTEKWVNTFDVTNKPEMFSVHILLRFVLAFLCYGLIGGIIYRIYSLMKQQDPGFIQSFLFGCKKVIPMFMVSILYTFSIFIGLIFLIIPGIMVSVYFVFAIYLIYQDFGIISSMKESYRLVKNEWWRTTINISLAILAVIIALLVIFVVIYLNDVLLQILMEHYKIKYPLLIMGVAIAIACPLIIFLYNFSIYFMLTCIYDLQIRKPHKE